jgi:hypothetical protein
MLKKFLLLLPVFAFIANIALAQGDELPPPSSKPQPEPQQSATMPDDGKTFQGFSKSKKVDWSKFIIEPDFYFNMGGNEIDLGFSPYVGYNVWKGLCVGGGVTYFYTGFTGLQFTDPSGRTYTANASWNTFGGGVFVQYNIWNGFFARARFEVLHRIMQDPYGNVTIQLNPQNNTYQVIIPKVQATIPAALVGVGYNLLRSKNFFLPIMVSYNVLNGVTDNTYSLYPNKWVVQLGFITIF